MAEFYLCYSTFSFLSKYIFLIHGNSEHSGAVNYYYFDIFLIAPFFLILWLFQVSSLFFFFSEPCFLFVLVLLILLNPGVEELQILPEHWKASCLLGEGGNEVGSDGAHAWGWHRRRTCWLPSPGSAAPWGPHHSSSLNCINKCSIAQYGCNLHRKTSAGSPMEPVGCGRRILPSLGDP